MSPQRPIADGAYPGIMPICTCGHYNASHETVYVHMFGRSLPHGPCHAPIAGYGTRCDCQMFVQRTPSVPRG